MHIVEKELSYAEMPLCILGAPCRQGLELTLTGLHRPDLTRATAAAAEIPESPSGYGDDQVTAC